MLPMTRCMSDPLDGRAMLTSRRNDKLYLIGVREQAMADNCARVTFFTTRGDLNAYARVSRGMRRAVILLGGDGCEHGFDPDIDLLAVRLAELGIGTIRLDYRLPGDCAQCAIDSLLACQYLDDEGIADVALVGWSFGAAVAIAAGSICRTVRGVAAVCPSDVSARSTRRLGRKPLLLMCGEQDVVRRKMRGELADWISSTLEPARAPALDSAVGAMTG